MRAPPHLRRWLLYLLFAVPVIFMPWYDYMGMTRTRYSLGWPISDMDLVIGNAFDDGRIVHFQPDYVLPLTVVFWTFVAGLAWRVRKWAKARPDWTGAFVQALLTSLYCAAVFMFLYGVVEVIWDYCLYPMNWSALERALVFARRWLPYLYALGVTAIFVTLFLDSRTRRGPQRLAYVAFALCFTLVAGRLSPYLEFQLRDLDEGIQISQDEQKKLK